MCRYLNALQTTAQHLLRYLAAAVVVNKRRRNAMKDLIRVIEQEAYEYSDPITQFLECLFVRYDFEGAQVRSHASAIECAATDCVSILCQYSVTHSGEQDEMVACCVCISCSGSPETGAIISTSKRLVM